MGTLTITNTLAALAAGNQPLSKIDQNFADIVSIINGNLDVVNVPSLAGKEPVLGNPASDGYLLSSTVGGVRSWIAPLTGQDLNMQVFTGNGTWTKPSGVSKVLIMLWGGGGGGGAGGTNPGSGGGAGAFGWGIYTVTGNVTVVIGSGGTGGTSGNGTAGNQSQVSNGGLPGTLTCGGGGYGSNFSGAGGAGGTPGAGWLCGITGQQGVGVGSSVSPYGSSGSGGDSPMGGGGGAGVTENNVGVHAGVEPGGGGAGGGGGNGGAGAKGRAIFIWLA